jgi:hypothetical protein
VSSSARNTAQRAETTFRIGFDAIDSRPRQAGRLGDCRDGRFRNQHVAHSFELACVERRLAAKIDIDGLPLRMSNSGPLSVFGGFGLRLGGRKEDARTSLKIGLALKSAHLVNFGTGDRYYLLTALLGFMDKDYGV